jgi:plasmid stabilization system protein ParE
MNKPAYTSAANNDLIGIVDYISRDKPGAALAWLDKIEAKCLFVANNPSLGDAQPHLGEGVRATAVGRYLIFHRESNGQMEILRVIPGDRDIRQL